MISYFVGGEKAFLKADNLSIWFFIIAILAVYFIQWLIVTWVASKFTVQTLKEKFYLHPVATIIFSFLYLIDLPRRLLKSGFGGGLLKLINAFEIIIYYAFISFLWWLLICWVSEKVWKKQRTQWSWYKKIIDKIFIFIPIIFKFILGLIAALLIFLILFFLIVWVFHYSGADLKNLFNY